jgi:hypothetical protein
MTTTLVDQGNLTWTTDIPIMLVFDHDPAHIGT